MRTLSGARLGLHIRGWMWQNLGIHKLSNPSAPHSARNEEFRLCGSVSAGVAAKLWLVGRSGHSQ